MELGQTRNLTEALIARRGLIHKSAAKDVERVMNKFKMAAITVAAAPAQNTGYTFWRKNETKEFINVLDDDSINPDDVVNCPICRDEFKKLSRKKKEKCLICGRIICNNCNSHSLPAKGLDGLEKEVKMCTTCHHTITKEQKRQQIKVFFEQSAKSGFTIFYEEVVFLSSIVNRDLPKLKALLAHPLTATSLKKAKELDGSVGSSLKDFEKEIKNLEHFQVTTKKQKQLMDSIKMFFITNLADNGPEYKLLHRQLEHMATQPLAPDEPLATSPAVLSTRGSNNNNNNNVLATTPPKGAITPNKQKRQTMLGSKLSSFTSLFSLDRSQNVANTPYISGVNPLLSPLSGGIQITIMGENFDDECGVEIGGVDCPVVERRPGTLVVVTPPQDSPDSKDVCVYNSETERCVMNNMLFYAEDSLFKKETPAVVEDNIFDYSTPPPIRSNNSSKNLNSYNNNNSNTNNNNSNNTNFNNSNNINNGNKNDTFSSTKTHTRTSSRTNYIIDNEEVMGELTVSMINPVVSPLQGTKITMELNRILPPGSIIKVSGKSIQFYPSDNNPKEVSFVSPSLPAGSKIIDITLPNGQVTSLDGLLLYESFIPQTTYVGSSSSSSSSSSFSSSFSDSYPSSTPPPGHTRSNSNGGGGGRVWGKRG